ncbi:MAG: hypothetical protein WBA89_18755 [Microcoleus sp.]
MLLYRAVEFKLTSAQARNIYYSQKQNVQMYGSDGSIVLWHELVT